MPIGLQEVAYKTRAWERIMGEIAGGDLAAKLDSVAKRLA